MGKLFMRAVGLVLAALTLGATLASSALAGGGPGPGPGSPPITFNLGAVTLNHQRAVVIAGTLTCVRPAEATLPLRSARRCTGTR